MASGISYDDSGVLASYFVVTFLAFILVPATYYSLRPPPNDPTSQLCRCSECIANNKRKIALRKRSRPNTFFYRLIALFLGWALLAYVLYGILTAPPAPELKIYDPFEILGISSSSEERAIKKHYKKLSLQFHPDKVKLGENETMADIETKFVEITKAYKSLTDEDTRENLKKYGNPDGAQQREDRIAIPKWVVEGKSGLGILALYAAVLGLGVPFFVGRWWFNTRRHTRDGILNPTAETFFHLLREDTDLVSLVSILASAQEFVPALSVPSKISKKERKERQARIEELEKTLNEKRAELLIFDSPTIRAESRVTVQTAIARRVRALLWAHLLRVELEPDLAAEQIEVLRILPPLLSGMTNISLAHNWLNTSLLCYNLQPSLVQAVPIGTSPLAQLPGISLDDAQRISITKGAEGRRWVEKFVKVEDSIEDHEEAKKVAKTWLRLEIVSAEFKVTGEKIVPPGSIVNLVYKARYVYPNAAPAVTANGVARGESVDVVEKSVEPREGEAEVNDSKAPVDEKAAIKTPPAAPDSSSEPSDKSKTESQAKPTGYIHAPHWPANRLTQFYVLLGDSKLDKVIVQPMRVGDIPLPNADGTPAEPKEYSLQFQAPPMPNLYSFVLHFCSDSLVGADVARPIMLRVEPLPEVEDDDEYISEPEEDSLAGQMALMRGGKVKPSDVHEYESEYETDTSDEEGPRRGRAINEDTDSDSD